MDIYSINKIHVKGLFSIYDIQTEKSNCILNAYKDIKVCVLEKPYELIDVLKLQKESKTCFHIYVFKHEPIVRYIQQFFNDETPNSRIAAISLHNVLMRSYYFYVVYFNKGIRSYMLNNDEFIRSFTQTLLSLILKCAKKSYISLNHQNISEIKLIVTIFVLYCILGVQSKSQVLSMLSKLQLDAFEKVKAVVFYNYFSEKLEQGKSLIHILGDLQKWNKLAQNTLLIHISRYLGSTLTDLFVTCSVKDIGDNLVSFAYKLSQFYFYYESGELARTANLVSLNRITDFAFGKLLKMIQLPIKKAYFGRC